MLTDVEGGGERGGIVAGPEGSDRGGDVVPF